jgi:ABC-2 type transport system ATP-binding protein
VLAARDLTRRFGDRIAVDHVSLELARGKVLALLGPNGSGKTTTLRMLAGLIAPTSGEVRLDGGVVTRDSLSRLRARMGFLTEAPGLWDRLTVRQNLTTYARLYGAGAGSIDRGLAALGLEGRAGDRTAELSKGLRQRVALARCLLHDPDILLLDEPTSGLDPQSARDLRQLIGRLRDDGKAILLSTHNLDEVERVADTVAVLRTRLIAVDSPAALRQRLFGARLRVELAAAAAPYAAALAAAGITDVHADRAALSIETNGQATTPEIVKRLVEAGAPIESVTREEPALEEVYLRLLHDGGGGS